MIIQSPEDLDRVWADATQLELAILNLALNARDAMPAGGTLRIEADNRRLESDGAPPGLPLGDYVVVSVSDTGIGMSRETLERAFEPFFTTKEVGRGSGLGLSIVHGFAAQSGGSVQIASAAGKGTRVDLWLPRAVGEGVKRAEAPPAPCNIGPGQARILVCDDDPNVLGLVGAVLRESGFAVWDTESPLQAFDVLEREWPLDLLLVDYSMPEMNGLALIDRAQARRPALKVLLMSGHSDVLRAGKASDIPLLTKPFKVAELRNRVAEILSLRSPAAGYYISA